ncbi:MAG: alpha/beta fold hydrolase [Isosphaeraceae bacterium]
MTSQTWRSAPKFKSGLGFLIWLATTSSAVAAPPQIPAYSDHTRLLEVKTPDGRTLPVSGSADWAVRRAHILGHLEAVMGQLPGPERRVPLETRVEGTFETPAFSRRKITFASEPGDRVPAWLLVPRNLKARAPGVLCLHQTTAIGKDEPAGLGGKTNLHYAKELAARGFVAIVPDYPNFGEYRVDPYKLGYASASMKGIWNHMRAIDLLVDLPEVDPDRLAVIGHSLGGHNAIFVGLFDPRLRVVVSSCGFNAFGFYNSGNIAGWSHAGYMPRLKETFDLDLKRVPFDFPELIGALAPRTFFTNSPLKDSNFDVRGVKVAIDSARTVYRLMNAEDQLHAAFPDAEHDFPVEEREAAYSLMLKTLSAPRSSRIR